jgi:hypothetical protein
MEQQQDDSNTFQLVLSTYRALLDDLKFMKQQQWLTAYYQILLLGGVFAFGHSDNGKQFSPYLAVVAWLVAAVGSLLVALIYYDMVKARARLNTIFIENLSVKQLQKIGLSESDIAEVRSKTYRGAVRGAEFMIVMIITAFVVTAFVSCSLQH